MDDHMGRRTVGGLLFTKGGSILLFREDSARHKATNCCTRHGCSSKHLAGKDKQTHRAATAAKEASETPRRSQIFRKPSTRTPQGSTATDNISRNAASSYSENDNRPRETPGRDLIARLKERVNASRKRSLNRENSPSSPNGLSATSSSSSRTVSRPSHRAASRIRKADEGANAGAVNVRRDSSGDTRRNSDRDVDDFLLVEQAARDSTEGFISGFLARYRSNHQGLLSSLDDSIEDANGYWRFNMEGSEELENYFIFNDRYRGMRMDIDGMSYEELLALGDRIGTVSTGLSEDALSKCLDRSMYMATTSGTHEDCERKCSICQANGEEVGKMVCKHYYHFSCIKNWLRQKNWCPICKSVALNTN
uniref:RING-type E3 ubiquitin transferase n=1 Tax=Oryza rufipogon TaxID=4529 RepID=A0A0E0PDN8_ORYRU